MRRLAKSLSLIVVIGLSPLIVATVPTVARAQGGTRWIVGVDRSASRTTQQMRDAREFVQGLVHTLTFGDEFTIMETFRTNSDSIRQWRGSVAPVRDAGTPLPRERRALEAFRNAAKITTRPYTDTTGQRQILSTDILGFLRRASDYARSTPPKRTVLILLSDMLNSTPALDMERRGGVPNAAWVTQQKTSGFIPDLKGVCIVAMGGETTTPRGVAVQRFWTAYFTAAGAVMKAANYRSFMGPGDIQC